MSTPAPDADSALRSVHTNNFPAILGQLGISLAVSTYQAGKLILVRRDGDQLNTHFRPFNKPMGLAADRQRFCLGTAYQIWELRNIPAVAAKLEPPEKHDACYLPRRLHITGDIDIHEMAIAADGELWFANTRFSCLCTLDLDHSFVPRWRPPFVSAYDLSDRCHLNGLGLRNGRPRYITALGATDSAEGWRANKAAGGILMDIERNEILYSGLSMPHSPRWYGDRLWVLESGKGSLAYLDANRRQLVTVAELPGFTRGLAFCGSLAFIGLSQVRETAAFSGIPLTQTRTERYCGIWVVDCGSGEILAFLRFEAAVQEIFAIAILPSRFPDVLLDNEVLLGSSYVLPDAALSETLHPDPSREFAQTHFERGNQLYAARELEGAIAAYRRCLELQADFLPARYNLGVTLGDLQQYAAAESELRAVLAAEASHAAAHCTLGHLYSQQARYREAIAHYEQAIQLEPQNAKAHHSLGINLLQMGDFARGWAECEWRWQTAEFVPFECPQPLWNGRILPTQTLLLHTEQGAGDAIQFARFIPLAAARCSRVLLVCVPALQPLFATLPGITERRSPGEIPCDAFATYAPLMSLPHLLGITLENLPADVPYLQADPSRLSLPTPANPGKRIGIVWAGSPTQANDHNRSCRLADFAPVLVVPGCEFFSLQKGDRAADLTDFASPTPIHDLAPDLHDYADTAAAIAQLDLVISVDTSVAHLAGALGKPVWTLLCHNADWRWLTDRADSPWYPTMRLFRQPQAGDWATVFTEVAAALTA
ncbi:MAG: TIGR03032 family protein [Spirulinaceae cyanobacterium SM2_1_0]|nr:TIGR03032 family protein [Spirulinaceae cyanobacterium SM2_1_0]